MRCLAGFLLSGTEIPSQTSVDSTVVCAACVAQQVCPFTSAYLRKSVRLLLDLRGQSLINKISFLHHKNNKFPLHEQGLQPGGLASRPAGHGQPSGVDLQSALFKLTYRQKN